MFSVQLCYLRRAPGSDFYQMHRKTKFIPLVFYYFLFLFELFEVGNVELAN